MLALLLVLLTTSNAFALTAADLERQHPTIPNRAFEAPAEPVYEAPAQTYTYEEPKEEPPTTRCADGTFIVGTKCVRCADGTYVANKCRRMPNGKYQGVSQ